MSSVVTNYYARSLMADHKNIMYEFAENHSGTHIDSDDQLINILQAVDAQEVTSFKKFDERMIVMETIWSPVYDGSYNIPGAFYRILVNYLHFNIALKLTLQETQMIRL